MHTPIQIRELSLVLPHKTCFEEFTCQIAYGSKIAIFGKNGSGKTSLLKLIVEAASNKNPHIHMPKNAQVAYVPQVIEDADTQSGGEKLFAAITAALREDPNILLLDEPTNHLDRKNRQALMRLLRAYPGTLLVVSHDREFLRNCVDSFWHLDHGKIVTFSGSYDDYLHERQVARGHIKEEMGRVQHEIKGVHESRMFEQKRAANSKKLGEKKVADGKWDKITGRTKVDQSEKHIGTKMRALNEEKGALSEQLASLRLPADIVPRFSIEADALKGRTLIEVRDGSCGYQEPLLSGFSFSVAAGEKLALTGPNGSGKTTIFKALLEDADVWRDGSWQIPKLSDIGYLDQHYNTLDPNKTVTQTMQALMPEWTEDDIKQHLRAFLFWKPEERNACCKTLSGGEKARLVLAQISARTPKVLLLDEVTNNLDLETQEHMVQVLSAYPGAMLIISHDEDFLNDIGCTERLDVSKFAGGS